MFLLSGLTDRNAGQRICEARHRREERHPEHTLSKTEKNRFRYMTRKYREDDRFQNRIIGKRKVKWTEDRRGEAAEAEGITSYRVHRDMYREQRKA